MPCVEARSQWSDPGSGEGTHLTWVPIDQMRDVAEEDIHALIARMSIANDERLRETPSTPPYPPGGARAGAPRLARP